MDYVKLISDLTKTFQDSQPMPSITDPAAVGAWLGKLGSDLVVIANDFGGFAGLKEGLRQLNNIRMHSPEMMAKHTMGAEAVGANGKWIQFIVTNLPTIITTVESIIALFGANTPTVDPAPTPGPSGPTA